MRGIYTFDTDDGKTLAIVTTSDHQVAVQIWDSDATIHMATLDRKQCAGVSHAFIKCQAKADAAVAKKAKERAK